MIYYTKFCRVGSLRKINEFIIKSRFLVFFLLITAAAAYFWQVTSLSVKGFQIKELEKNIQQLKTENKKLELDLTAQESMINLEERVKDLNLVAVDKVEYLTVVSPVVALR